MGIHVSLFRDIAHLARTPGVLLRADLLTHRKDSFALSSRRPALDITPCMTIGHRSGSGGNLTISRTARLGGMTVPLFVVRVAVVRSVVLGIRVDIAVSINVVVVLLGVVVIVLGVIIRMVVAVHIIVVDSWCNSMLRISLRVWVSHLRWVDHGNRRPCWRLRRWGLCWRMG
jgi:hypothetical protein